VDTALKLAIAYHRQRGEGHRIRLIGREKGYHGVNFGGTAVGGIVGNRKIFGALVTGVDHIRHTHDLGAERVLARPAQARRRARRGPRAPVPAARPSTIAAVIVEPVACSAACRAARGYLQKLREICDKHGILLIFDEVITGWGASASLRADYFGVMPDLITSAKGITNGTVPMGAVFMKETSTRPS
jgi:beta-alanine--pyruvate transaminase